MIVAVGVARTVKAGWRRVACSFEMAFSCSLIGFGETGGVEAATEGKEDLEDRWTVVVACFRHTPDRMIMTKLILLPMR